MLVKLLNLEEHYDFPELLEHGVKIVRPLAPDNHLVLEFIKTHFAESWASEVAVALNQPFPTYFVAIKKTKVNKFT